MGSLRNSRHWCEKAHGGGTGFSLSGVLWENCHQWWQKVEYALHESNKPIGVATYRVVRTLPAELRGELPGPEQIAKLLEGME